MAGFRLLTGGKMKIIILLVTFCWCSLTHAGLVIEPFYDSMFSDSTREKNVPAGATESRWDNGGYAQGLRLYVSHKIKNQAGFVGFQGMLSKTNWQLTSPESEVDAFEDDNRSATDKWRGKHLGLIIGTGTPIFNAWASAMYTEIKNRNNDGTFDKNDELFGTSIEVGIGLKLISWLKVNMTFRNHKFDKYWDSSQRTSHTLPSTSRSYGDFDVKEYYAGISIPITFGKMK